MGFPSEIEGEVDGLSSMILLSEIQQQNYEEDDNFSFFKDLCNNNTGNSLLCNNNTANTDSMWNLLATNNVSSPDSTSSVESVLEENKLAAAPLPFAPTSMPNMSDNVFFTDFVKSATVTSNNNTAPAPSTVPTVTTSTTTPNETVSRAPKPITTKSATLPTTTKKTTTRTTKPRSSKQQPSISSTVTASPMVSPLPPTPTTPAPLAPSMVPPADGSMPMMYNNFYSPFLGQPGAPYPGYFPMGFFPPGMAGPMFPHGMMPTNPHLVNPAATSTTTTLSTTTTSSTSNTTKPATSSRASKKSATSPPQRQDSSKKSTKSNVSSSADSCSDNENDSDNDTSETKEAREKKRSREQTNDDGEDELKNLTPEERAKEAKRQRRLIKNRESAQASRERKRMYVENLEKKLTTLTAQNAQLSTAVFSLESENMLLRQRLQALQTTPAKDGQPAAETSLPPVPPPMPVMPPLAQQGYPWAAFPWGLIPVACNGKLPLPNRRNAAGAMLIILLAFILMFNISDIADVDRLFHLSDLPVATMTNSGKGHESLQIDTRRVRNILAQHAELDKQPLSMSFGKDTITLSIRNDPSGDMVINFNNTNTATTTTANIDANNVVTVKTEPVRGTTATTAAPSDEDLTNLDDIKSIEALCTRLSKIMHKIGADSSAACAVDDKAAAAANSSTTTKNNGKSRKYVTATRFKMEDSDNIIMVCPTNKECAPAQSSANIATTPAAPAPAATAVTNNNKQKQQQQQQQQQQKTAATAAKNTTAPANNKKASATSQRIPSFNNITTSVFSLFDTNKHHHHPQQQQDMCPARFDPSIVAGTNGTNHNNNNNSHNNNNNNNSSSPSASDLILSLIKSGIKISMT